MGFMVRFLTAPKSVTCAPVRARHAFCSAAAALTLAIGCAAPQTHVRIDDASLGKVVVYRNGVAFYERRARLTGPTLTVQVPAEKVDDFLKSLTVMDAKTRKPLSVAFPRNSSQRPGVLAMTIGLPPGNATTDVILSYVTDSPAWKPTYRIKIGDRGKVSFEGWAVVDNTSGEDWNKVRVGVGSSSALSFRYDLWSVRSVEREKLSTHERFAAAPPRGVSPYGDKTASKKVLSQFSGEEIRNAPAPPPAIADEDAAEPADVATLETTARTRGPRRRTKPSKTYTAAVKKRKADHRRAQNRVVHLAQQLKKSQHKITIEGFAARGEKNAQQRARERANTLRNQLIYRGVAPGNIKVSARGYVQGHSPGVRVVEQEHTEVAGKTGARRNSTQDAPPVGESHFETPTPMTVKRDTSVMVALVKERTPGEVVYYYDPDAKRGNARYAFRAVRVKNPTNATLETGPVTVYGNGRFVGEGLTEPIPPHASSVIPFALDRQIVVDSDSGTRDEIASLVTLQRGILTANVQHIRRRTLTLTSRLHVPVKVYLRHAAQSGWKLTKRPSKPEKLRGSYVFEVTLAAKETKEFHIEEATPIQKTVDLRTRAGLELVKVYLSSSPDDPIFAGKIRSLLALYTKMRDHQLAIASLRHRLSDFRTRMDELHGQIVSLKAVKTRGALMKHLKTKMADISKRVQSATIELDNLHEKVMLAKISFQDGVAELTVELPKTPIKTATRADES